MSARGYVFIESTDDAKLRQTEYVKSTLNPWQVWLQEGVQPDHIELYEVNWLAYEELIRQAPEVCWIAYMEPDTELPNQAIIHLPGDTDVTWMRHIDYDVVVSLDKVFEQGLATYMDKNPEVIAYLTARRLINQAKGKA